MTDPRRTLAELDRLLKLSAGVQSFTYPPAPREPERVPAVLVERIARAAVERARIERPRLATGASLTADPVEEGRWLPRL